MNDVTPEGIMAIILSLLFAILVIFDIVHIAFYLGLISYEQTLPSIQPMLILISIITLLTSLNIFILLKIIRAITSRYIVLDEDGLFILAVVVLLMEIVYMVRIAKIPLPEIAVTISKYFLIALVAQPLVFVAFILIASIIDYFYPARV